MRIKLYSLVLMSILLSGCGVASASQQVDAPTTTTTTTTTITVTTPDVASAEAAIRESIGQHIAAIEEQQRREAEAAAKASATRSRSVAPNYDPGDGSMWDRLAQCESGGNWAYPPVAGGFSGGLMFHIGTWRSMGGTEYAPDAYLATREQQIEIAERTRAATGGSMRPWPGCSRKFGWL